MIATNPFGLRHRKTSSNNCSLFFRCSKTSARMTVSKPSCANVNGFSRSPYVTGMPIALLTYSQEAAIYQYRPLHGLPCLTRRRSSSQPGYQYFQIPAVDKLFYESSLGNMPPVFLFFSKKIDDQSFIHYSSNPILSFTI